MRCGRAADALPRVLLHLRRHGVRAQRLALHRRARPRLDAAGQLAAGRAAGAQAAVEAAAERGASAAAYYW